MPEDKAPEYPVIDGAPLNPYDVRTPAPDAPKDADERPEADGAETMDVPGPGGDPKGMSSADDTADAMRMPDDDAADPDDEKPARRRK